MRIKENKVTKKIDLILDSYGADITRYRPVPGVYGKKHVDYICCIRGFYFVIEAKRPDEEVAPHQADTIREVLRAGGAAFVIDGKEEQFKSLEAWLVDIKRTELLGERPAVVLPKPKVLETPT